MRRTLVAALAAALVVAGVSFARPEGSLPAVFLPVASHTFGASTVNTALVQSNGGAGGYLRVDPTQAATTTLTLETDVGVIASDTRQIVIRKFSCWFTASGTSGTINLNLVAFHADSADSETLGTISFNVATQLNTIREDTTFATPTLTPPYFLGVRAADGGSASITAGLATCPVMWSW